MEEKNETVKDEHYEDEGKERIETADELMKEKADNKFIARENSAQIQIFVQNANWLLIGCFPKIICKKMDSITWFPCNYYTRKQLKSQHLSVFKT